MKATTYVVLLAGGTMLLSAAAPSARAQCELAKLTAMDAAQGDEFGESVAIKGDYAVVAAIRDDDAGSSSGSAYVFGRDDNGTPGNLRDDTWVQVDKLTANDAAAEDLFGVSVALDDDYIVVGARDSAAAGDNSGSAYVFWRDGNDTPEDPLDDAWIQSAKLTAPDAAQDDHFGNAVAISGDYIVVGAVFDDDMVNDSGLAYVFPRDDNGTPGDPSDDNWVDPVKLVATLPVSGHRFGSSVSISGDYVAIGEDNGDACPPLNEGCNGAGAAYLFRRDDVGTPNDPTDDDWAQMQKISADPDNAIGDLFGVSVSIDGDLLVVGASRDDDACNPPTEQCNSGSLYVFQLDSGPSSDPSWALVAKLTADDAAAEDGLGSSVSISGATVVAGAQSDDDGGSNSGSAYVFQPVAGAWDQVAKLTALDAAADDNFGRAVGVGGDSALVGSYHDDDDDAGDESGSAYLFDLAGPDCNTNGVCDGRDIANGTSPDVNGNGVPDECDECVDNAGCADDGLYCTGVEACVSGVCESSGDPCASLGLVCDEDDDTCKCDEDTDCEDGVACTDDTCGVDGTCASAPNNANCISDGLFCNGAEVCDAVNDCVSTGDPCPAGEFCNDTTDECDECQVDGDCDDGEFCTGVEACVGGSCVAGTDPCPEQSCDEVNDECECDDNADCDDGEFCTGIETCVGGACVSAGGPCSGQGLVCDEANDECDCNDNADCGDGLFCNGAESCQAGACASGANPCPGESCDEENDLCYTPQCATHADCDDSDPCTTDVCADELCSNVPVAGCTDDDADGVPDDRDDCLETAAEADVDGRGCSCDQLDADGDEVDNCVDECSDTPIGAEVNGVGCSCRQLDGDGDGVNNCDDDCAGTPPGSAVDGEGCAKSQRDDDGDGVFNSDDFCPGTPAGETTDAHGCGSSQGDDDRDGVRNGQDLCADSPAGQPVNDDGCPVATDADDDGVGEPLPDDEEPDGGPVSTSGSGGGTGTCGLLGVVPLAFMFFGLTALRMRRRG
ncbi:MAG: FG-GAP repeat protein [Planctomycetota bacterium]